MAVQAARAPLNTALSCLGENLDAMKRWYNFKQWLLVASQLLAIAVSCAWLFWVATVGSDWHSDAPIQHSIRAYAYAFLSVFFAGALANCHAFFSIPVV